MNGIINQLDNSYITHYCDETYTPTNSDWLLSDTNADGMLDYNDLIFD